MDWRARRAKNLGLLVAGAMVVGVTAASGVSNGRQGEAIGGIWSGSGLWLVGAVTALATVLAADWTTREIRRRGRDRLPDRLPADMPVGTGGPAGPGLDVDDHDGPGGHGHRATGTGDREGERLVDPAELEAMVTADPSPPADLDPARGGIVLAEEVRANHLAAWLLHAAHRGAVEIDVVGEGTRDEGVRVVRTATATDDLAPFLDTAFDGRTRMRLGTRRLHAGYTLASLDLWHHLDRWRRTSGLWARRSDGAIWTAEHLGLAVGLAGLGAAYALGFALASLGGWWPFLAAIGGAIAGAGAAVGLGSFELATRTGEGAAAWLRVESFRRFLATCEPHHAEEVAARGDLLEHTAWAVAVGEADHWADTVAASNVGPEATGVRCALLAPRLTSMIQTSAGVAWRSAFAVGPSPGG